MQQVKQSQRLTAEVQGLAMASRNASDAQSMIDTADSALGETTNLLLRMRELAVQASNGLGAVMIEMHWTLNMISWL